MTNEQHEKFTGSIEVDVTNGELSRLSINGLPADILHLLTTDSTPSIETETNDCPSSEKEPDD